jgi:hypothetical protein
MSAESVPQLIELLTRMVTRLQYLDERLAELEIDLSHEIQSGLAKKLNRGGKIPSKFTLPDLPKRRMPI